MGKGALTCSSSSGSTFAKVLGKTCGVFLGWLRHSTRKSPSVRDECHVCKRVYWHRHRETAKSQYGGHEHVQLLKLHSGCSGTAWHGAVDIEPAAFSAIPSLAHFTCLENEGRVCEQAFCFLRRLGALGNCCSRFNIFGIAGIDAPPSDSSHTAQSVPFLIQVTFGAFHFSAQVEKGRLGDLKHARGQWYRRWESTFVATCSSHVHIAKPGSLTTSWSAWVSRGFVRRCGCY